MRVTRRWSNLSTDFSTLEKSYLLLRIAKAMRIYKMSIDTLKHFESINWHFVHTFLFEYIEILKFLKSPDENWKSLMESKYSLGTLQKCLCANYPNSYKSNVSQTKPFDIGSLWCYIYKQGWYIRSIIINI